MDKEKLKDTGMVAEIRSYIDEKYPVKQENVDVILKEAGDFDGRSANQAAFLRKRAVFMAMEHGIVKVTDEKHFPNYHVPTLLAAIREIEKDVPDLEKMLPVPIEVKLLAVAEFTNAKRFADEGSLSIASFTVKAAQELSSFYERLRTSRGFSRFFVATRK